MDDPLIELQAYVQLTDVDLQCLAKFWPVVEPHVPAVIDHFYAKALAFEGTRQVLVDESLVKRLAVTLAAWLSELLQAPRDRSYHERRQRIGRRHVEVGLDGGYLYTAGQVIADDLAAIAGRELPPDEAIRTISALHRAITVDLAVITSSYVEDRERRSAAELQDLLVRHLRVMVLLADAEGRVTAATRTAVELVGDDLVGQPWPALIPEDLRAAGQLDKAVARALETGVEVALPRVDVGDRTYGVHVVPLEHAMARFLLQIEDLTEAVSLEARLRRTESLAQLGALSAAVAHELRNPLAGISGAIQVIGRSIPPEAPYAPVMLKVEAEIRRLDTLVADLLAFARPSAPRLQRVDLADAAQRAVELVGSTAGGPGIAVRGAGSAQADPNLVHQILLNLLQNALQAVGADGRVEITVADGSITVADDGPGVAPEAAPRLFEPFFTTKTRGTGLGLAICQRAATGMGGRVALVPSGALGGATFTLTLQP